MGQQASLRGAPLWPTGSKLVVEIKWQHWPDHEFELMLFAKLLKEFALYPIFLQFVTCWLDTICTPVQRAAMLAHLRRVPVVRRPTQ